MNEYLKKCENCKQNFKTNIKKVRFCSRNCANQFNFRDKDLFNKINELVIQDKTSIEIAKILNKTSSAIIKFCQRNNLPLKVFTNQHTEEDIKKIFDNKYPGFQYVGGYEGSEGFLKCKCKKCGNILKKTSQCVRPSRKQKLICEYCNKVEKDNKAKELLKLKEERKKVLQEQIKIKESKKKLEQLKKRKLIKCNYCGTTFINENHRVKYCSKDCLNKFNNKKKDINRRKLMINNGKIDYSITLEKLIKRDNNICHICNKQCDINDYKIIDSHFVVGNNYPSIDHIIPISKGGTHTKDNIKLSHFICNTKKSNKTLYFEKNGQLKMFL